jgi:hypothetical protein
MRFRFSLANLIVGMLIAACFLAVIAAQHGFVF